MLDQMKIEFRTTAELPTAWIDQVTERVKVVSGGKGLGRYVWAVAAIFIMQADERMLRNAASDLRGLATTDPEKFADIYSVIEEVAEAIRNASKPPKRKNA